MKPDLTPHLDRLAGDACDYHVENASAPTGNHANAEELATLRATSREIAQRALEVSAENERLRVEVAQEREWRQQSDGRLAAEIQSRVDVEHEIAQLHTQVTSLEAAGELLAEANRQAEAEVDRLKAGMARIGELQEFFHIQSGYIRAETGEVVRHACQCDACREIRLIISGGSEASPATTGSGGEADLPAAINTVAAQNRAELAQEVPHCPEKVNRAGLTGYERLEGDFRDYRLWQYDDTGRMVWAYSPPSRRWHAISVMYEDELPADIAEAEYDEWFSQSAVVMGVRMGPKR